MSEIRTEIELSQDGSAVLVLREDRRRLQVDLEPRKSGLTKTDVSTLIRALEKLREKMER
jgi:hypothetical protein